MRSRHLTAFICAFVFGLATPRVVDPTRAAGADVEPIPPIVISTPPAPPEAETLARELLHTDRLIAVLKPKIVRSGNQKALEELADAVKREQEARDAYENNLFARSARLTRESRSLAREAAVLVGPPEEDPVYVSRTIEHAEDALSLAEDTIQGVDDPAVHRRFAMLTKDLAGARQLFRTGALRRANDQANAVRDGVLDLLTDCEGLPVSSDIAAKALKRAERAVERAGKELGPKLNPPAQRLQKEAVGQLAKARASFARKDYQDAVIHSKLVERNLDDALGAQRGGAKAGVSSDA
ncbi:MAG: hypothetical protein ACRENN_10885 [Candidatus Eiseniibacteriota bacterium]